MTDLFMVDSGDKELDAIILGPNYYVMVKFASKNSIHHYAGMIVKRADEFAGDFEVTFLKCSQKSVTASRFTIPDEEDIVDVPFGDIIARLLSPTVIGGTKKKKKMVVFSVDGGV